VASPRIDAALQHASTVGARAGESLKQIGSPAEKSDMSLRRCVALIGCAAGLMLPASASAAHSVGSREQVSWVRSAAGRFVAAELAGNGVGACAVLNAPLRASRNHRSCAERWNAKLAALLHEPGAATRLRSEQHAIPSAVVIVHGYIAQIELPTPLMSGPNRFLWSENCWMLRG
jgi:hypothetical protein